MLTSEKTTATRAAVKRVLCLQAWRAWIYRRIQSSGIGSSELARHTSSSSRVLCACESVEFSVASQRSARVLRQPAPPLLSRSQPSPPLETAEIHCPGLQAGWGARQVAVGLAVAARSYGHEPVWLALEFDHGLVHGASRTVSRIGLARLRSPVARSIQVSA